MIPISRSRCKPRLFLPRHVVLESDADEGDVTRHSAVLTAEAGLAPGALPSASAAAPGAGGADGRRLQRLLRRGGRRMLCSFQTRQGNARHSCLGAVRDSECSARSRSCRTSGAVPLYPLSLVSSPAVSVKSDGL